MPTPAAVIMDDLDYIRVALVDEARFDAALCLDTLIEAANAAGHQVYTWSGVAEYVRRRLSALSEAGSPLDEDVLELVEAALSPPRNP